MDNCTCIPSYRLTSLATKVRERTKKLEVMKARIERKESFEGIKFEGGEVKIESDRVIIHYDERPSKEAIAALKSKVFRWSPKFKSWLRKHTAQAIYDAQAIIKIK